MLTYIDQVKRSNFTRYSFQQPPKSSRYPSTRPRNQFITLVTHILPLKSHLFVLGFILSISSSFVALAVLLLLLYCHIPLQTLVPERTHFLRLSGIDSRDQSFKTSIYPKERPCILRATILSKMLSISRAPTKRIISSLSRRRFYAVPAGGDPPNKIKYIPTSGTYPKGFLAGSAHAGVKASNTKYDDLALIASEKPCPAACVFTQNVFKAAPVQISSAILRETKGDGIQGVVVNSGCANAVTGKGGLEDAILMAKKTDEMFGLSSSSSSESDVAGLKSLVMSTGVIGQRYAFRLPRLQICHLILTRSPVSQSPKSQTTSPTSMLLWELLTTTGFVLLERSAQPTPSPS